MKIEIWGTYPPPVGGVSIHVFRFIHTVIKIQNILLKDFNGKGKHDFPFIKKVDKPLKEFLLLPFQKRKIIHVHSSRFIVFVFLLLFGIRHKIVFTSHGKHLYDRNSVFQLMVAKLFFKRVNAIIMNDESYAKLFALKFKVEKRKIHIIPAYIKPLEVERQGLPEALVNFRKKTKFLISANGYQLWKNNEGDVYGLDLLIALMHKLKNDGIKAGLIFCLPQIGDEELYRSYKKQIKDLNLDNEVLIYQKPLSNGFEVWEMSDLFIRPTLTDIEGISVKEALDFGTPALVSDVCTRPAASVLFKKGDIQDLYSKTIEIINHYKRVDANFDMDNAVDEILSIYNKL